MILSSVVKPNFPRVEETTPLNVSMAHLRMCLSNPNHLVIFLKRAHQSLGLNTPLWGLNAHQLDSVAKKHNISKLIVSSVLKLNVFDSTLCEPSPYQYFPTPQAIQKDHQPQQQPPKVLKFASVNIPKPQAGGLGQSENSEEGVSELLEEAGFHFSSFGREGAR